MKSRTKYFSAGSIVAESHEAATGLMVITSGTVGVELPLDLADNEKERIASVAGGSATLMCVFKRGYVALNMFADYAFVLKNHGTTMIASKQIVFYYKYRRTAFKRTMTQ
jgi:hypothetical protein